MENTGKTTWTNKYLIALIFSLAWPTMLEHALQVVVIYVDAAMVGSIGPKATAAVGLTTSMTWLIGGPMFALGVGVLAFIARAKGAKQYEHMKIAGIQAIFIVITIGIFMGVITLSISPFLPKWMGAEPDIQENATRYFAIICMPMIFKACSIIFASVLRATGDTKVPMRINLIMNIINVVLNYLLIYETRTIQIGNCSIPMIGANLGVTGAAIATAIATTVGGILMFWAYYNHPMLTPKGRKICIHKTIMGQCIKVGIPVALQRTAVYLGQVVFTSLVAGLGTIAFATHAIALTAEEAFYIPGYGMQDATSALIGNAIGERDKKKMERLSVLLIAIAFLIMTITGGLLFLFPGFMMSLFTKDATVIAGGIIILRIVAVTEPIYGAMIILEGIFNGAGDTKTPFFVAVFTMWGIRIASAIVCVKILHMGLNAVWICMVADNIVRCLLLGIRFKRGSWKKKLIFQL